MPFELILIIAVVLTLLPHNYHFIFLKLKKPPVIPKSKKPFYLEYMNSYEWRKKRLQRLEKDKFMCQNHIVRLVNKNLQVHHKTYKRLGNERITDLVTVCEKCHNKIHSRNK